MHIQRRSLSKIKSESFLIGILHLISLLSLYTDADKKRGRPDVYPTTVILRCYVTRIWMRIPSNNCLYQYLAVDMPYNRKVMRACGLHALPDRRTFDRRFKILPIGDIVSAMGARFVIEGIADCSITSLDSSMVRARGYKVWHKKDMASNTMPRSGIDTDARWGFSATRGWTFGYKMHISCTTGDVIVPLSACISPANVQDNKMYQDLVEGLPDTVRYIVADAGYEDYKLYDYSRRRGIRLIYPIRRYRRTKGDRLKLVSFYKSSRGQRIYWNRSVSIEPLFQCIKDTFGISVLPVRGFDNVSSYILMCVLVYQIAVYRNCILGSKNPRCVKYMLGN
jgi:IS5 family transposase